MGLYKTDFFQPSWKSNKKNQDESVKKRPVGFFQMLLNPWSLIGYRVSWNTRGIGYVTFTPCGTVVNLGTIRFKIDLIWFSVRVPVNSDTSLLFLPGVTTSTKELEMVELLSIVGGISAKWLEASLLLLTDSEVDVRFETDAGVVTDAVTGSGWTVWFVSELKKLQNYCLHL